MKRFTETEKDAILSDAKDNGLTLKQVSQKYGVGISTLSMWRAQKKIKPAKRVRPKKAKKSAEKSNRAFEAKEISIDHIKLLLKEFEKGRNKLEEQIKEQAYVDVISESQKNNYRAIGECMFKVGDKVLYMGVLGVVVEVDVDPFNIFPVVVEGITDEEIDDSWAEEFTHDGRLHTWHKEPSLRLAKEK
jgi:transposase-like protein